jgi:hypothetical protein
MAAGDATKVWFKNVEELLVSRWRGDVSAEELAALAADLTKSATRHREEHGILPPVYYCPRCEKSDRVEPPVIHVGSMLFAAKRLGLIGEAELSRLQQLSRRYSKHRRRVLARTEDQAYRPQKRPANHRGCH